MAQAGNLRYLELLRPYAGDQPAQPWTDAFWRVVNSVGWDDDLALLVAGSKLTGKAEQWFQLRRPFASVADFVQRLQTQYPAPSTGDALTELRQCKMEPGETVTDFAERFQTVARYDQAPEYFKLRLFYNSRLPPLVRAALLQERPATLADAIQAALTAERYAKTVLGPTFGPEWTYGNPYRSLDAPAAAVCSQPPSPLARRASQLWPQGDVRWAAMAAKAVERTASDPEETDLQERVRRVYMEAQESGGDPMPPSDQASSYRALALATGMDESPATTEDMPALVDSADEEELDLEGLLDDDPDTETEDDESTDDGADEPPGLAEADAAEEDEPPGLTEADSEGEVFDIHLFGSYQNKVWQQYLANQWTAEPVGTDVETTRQPPGYKPADGELAPLSFDTVSENGGYGYPGSYKCIHYLTGKLPKPAGQPFGPVAAGNYVTIGGFRRGDLATLAWTEAQTGIGQDGELPDMSRYPIFKTFDPGGDYFSFKAAEPIVWVSYGAAGLPTEPATGGATLPAAPSIMELPGGASAVVTGPVTPPYIDPG